MVGTVYFPEPAIEFACVINQGCKFNSSYPLKGQNTSIVLAPRRRKQSRITSRSSSIDGGAIVLDKEFEFKPSFDEYLKALESVSTDRNDGSNVSSPTRKKSIKKTVREEKGEDARVDPLKDSRKAASQKRNVFVPEDSRKGASQKNNVFVSEDSRKGASLKKNVFAREDSRGGLEKSPELVRKTQNVNVKNLGAKRSGGAESKMLDLERVAFKPLEKEDDFMDRPRISKLDMEERIRKLAKSLNGADIDMPEWKFSEMMRSAQIRFSDYSIRRVVQILGDLGNWRRVLQLIEWIQSRERFKSHKIRNIYTAALDALGKARRPVEALNLFHVMQGQMASYPDIVAYRCIAVTLGQAGHMKELFDVIDSMRSPPQKKFKTGYLEKWDPRLEPDIVVYNAVLNACVRRKKWEGAFWVLQQISEQGQQPSMATYGLVMEVMLACEKYNLVHDFFKKVQKAYIPNALIYKVLVNALWREGRTEEAVMAVEEMERRGIVGNASLYYDLARCLCSVGRCKEALKLIDKICKVANKPLVVTYTGLIQACLDSGDVQNGAYVFNQMQKFCTPNLVTCNIMIKAFLDHGMFEEAKQLFLNLLENANFIKHEEDYKVRAVPDIYSFNTMLEGCYAKHKWDDLVFVYEQMLKYGHHFNAKRHLRLILDARRAGKLETRMRLLEGLVGVSSESSTESPFCQVEGLTIVPESIADNSEFVGRKVLTAEEDLE
ncbi:pentatricopeptide repeat-containing protein chloroplastic [Dorcoceras hygrometricum]|uniref:Pentatricopeptide repeat-containing protein chloroplastic n=1 Tax=Dorcoceras hygrometricum TaxID=472368 RepID=A0A2Z7BBT8_9LAMI|nr:pentatricopeptide repeat-containing protein chloroplastic [Dorcoceras hygrometricum]